MPFVDPTDSIAAVVTDTGRNIIANAQLGTLAYQLLGFKVGRGGYTLANPVKIDPINTLATDLIDPVFPVPTTGLANFVAIEQPFPNVVAPVCRLNQSQALYGLGELGVWVQILNNAGGPVIYTVGSQWLFALAHMPLLGKNSNTVFVLRLLLSI